MFSRLTKMFGSDIKRDKLSHLILMRHGQAKAADFNGEDMTRELTEAGKGQAEEIGDWLDQVGGAQIDQVLVSPATRALQTYMAVAFKSKRVPDTWQVTPELYETSINGYRDLVDNCQTSALMMIGHNPMIGTLASELSASSSLDKAKILNMAPGTCCVFQRAEGSEIEFVLQSISRGQ